MQILEGCELAAMTLEYRRECRRDSVLQSLTSVLDKGIDDLTDFGNVECQHVLRLENGGEVVKGRTEWRPKLVNGIGSLDGYPAESA